MVVTTTAELMVNPPQYVEESTEGTTPTASPTFVACGAVKSLGIKINGNFVDVAQLASEDLVSIIQGLQEYESQMTLTMVNSTFLKYGVNSANYGTPTGTISAPLSILFSIYLNGTLNYIIMKGSRIKDCSITMERGKETEISVTMLHKTIITPITTTDAGLTSPTFVTAVSGPVLSHTDGGVDPISWNAVGLDCIKCTININRNTKSDHTLGNLDPFGSQPHGRRISGDMTLLWTTTTLETDKKAGTARSLVMTIDTGVSTLTLANCVITDYARTKSIDDGSAAAEVCTFRGPTAVLT